VPFIPDKIRDKHIYLPGMPGQGKTTTMLAHAKQDIYAGRGVTYIDPAGDAVKKLIHWIPKERIEQTIWYSVRDQLPLDFLSYDNPFEKERVVGDLIYILAKDPDQTPRMTPILRDVIYTFIELPDRTFLDIYRFFEDSSRQREILKHTTQKMRERWKKMPSDKELETLLYRISVFERVPTLQAIFGTPYPKINVPEILKKGFNLLVDLDDSEAGILLGQLFVAQFKRSAFARRELLLEERTPYCLYCDEFQNFQMPDFEKIITQGRKYNLWLTLANQGLYQLDDMIKQAVMRTGTKIIFQLAPDDAHAFKHIHENLTAIPPFHAVYKIGSQPPVVSRIPPPAPYHEGFAPEIRDYTKAHYAPPGYKRIVDNAPSHDDENMVPLKDDGDRSPDSQTLLSDYPKERRVRAHRPPRDSHH
jgi:hypothetical protein